jgi:hypothetical protein
MHGRGGAISFPSTPEEPMADAVQIYGKDT